MNVRATSTYTPRNDIGQFIATNVTPAVRDAAQAAGDLVLARAVELVPVDTGELRDSGHVVVTETERSVVASVIFDADHAGYVEYGTGIRGANSAGAGPYPYNPTWPGMPAQPYLRPAALGSNDEILNEFSTRIRE